MNLRFFILFCCVRKAPRCDSYATWYLIYHCGMHIINTEEYEESCYQKESNSLHGRWLEHSGMFRPDDKHSNGMILVSWNMGRAQIWEATCVDTPSPSHLVNTSNWSYSAAELAERFKRQNYQNLDSYYLITPFIVKNPLRRGVPCSSLSFFKILAQT